MTHLALIKLGVCVLVLLNNHARRGSGDAVRGAAVQLTGTGVEFQTRLGDGVGTELITDIAFSFSSGATLASGMRTRQTEVVLFLDAVDSAIFRRVILDDSQFSADSAAYEANEQRQVFH